MKFITRIIPLVVLLLPFRANAQLGGTAIGQSIFYSSASITDRDLSTATKWQAQGFSSPFTDTLEEICIYISSVVGVVGSTDARVDFDSDTAGSPGSSLLNFTVNAGTTGYKCSGVLSQAVTGGNQYWITQKNLNGTPGSNYFTIRWLPDGLVGIGGGGTAFNIPRIGAAGRETSNSGSDGWLNNYRSGAANYRLKFTNHGYYGFTATNTDAVGNPVAAGDRVYSTNEVGNKFTTPQNGKMNLAGVAFLSGIATGTPTGTLRFRLYSGTTLVDTTYSAGSVTTLQSTSGGVWVPLYFPTVHALTPNTTYRIVAGETAQSDTSSNSYGLYRIDWDSNANSLPLKPYGGSLSKTVCTGSCSGGTWTDTTTSIYPMFPLLDFGNEFAVNGSVTAGLINQNHMNGGLQ